MAAFLLPKIYEGQMLDKVEEALTKNIGGACLVVVEAPTGYGKTFGLTRLVAKLTRKYQLETGHILMPFRSGLKPMYNYNILANSHLPPISLGYTMRNDCKTSRNDEVRLSTVGFWLESQIHLLRNPAKLHSQIMDIDEVHDPKTDTDLALRLVLHAIRRGAPIKLIVSSATIDIVDMIKSFNAFSDILTVVQSETAQKVANYDLEFSSHELPVGRGDVSGLTDACVAAMMKALASTWKRVTGYILIIVPGQDDINKMINAIELVPDYNDAAIYPLHSNLASEEIEAAINHSRHLEINTALKRAIIVSTNMVENSITIDGVDAVIDCCYRKVLHVSDDGIKSLKVEKASKSNVRQAAGRCGRQGRRGLAMLTITLGEYERLAFAATKEVQTNPLYTQIVKIVAADSGGAVKSELDPYDIFSDLPESKITGNIRFLIENECLLAPPRLEETKENKGWGEDHDEFESLWKPYIAPTVTTKNVRYHDLTVTPLGKIVTRLPCSVRAGRFLVKAVQSLNPEMWYFAALITAWIDMNGTIFYRPTKRPRESDESFSERLAAIRELQRDFYSNDCLETLIKAWCTSSGAPRATFRAWCASTGIYERALGEIDKNIKGIIRSMKDAGYDIYEPSGDELTEILPYVTDIKKNYHPLLQEIFSKWCFRSVGYQGQLAPIQNGGIMPIKPYLLDRSLPSLGDDEQSRVVAFSLRDVGRKIILSNIAILS